MSEVEHDNSLGPTGRPRRAAAPSQHSNGRGDAQEAPSESDEDGTEAEFGDDEDDVDAHVPEESEEEEDEFDENEAMVADDIDDQPQSLLVKLSVTPPKLRTVLLPNMQAVNFRQVVADDGQTKAEPQIEPLSEMKNGNVAEADKATEDAKVTQSADNMSQVAHPVDKNYNKPQDLAPGSVDAQPSMSQDASLSATALAYRSPEKRIAQLATSATVSVGREE
jgi:hypothetical protein